MTTLVLSGMAVQSIAFYQRYLSPRKGFCCAHRVSKRGWSCSRFGKRVFERYSVNLAFVLLKRRLRFCKAAAAQIAVLASANEKDDSKKEKKNSVIDYCDIASGCDGASLASHSCNGCDIGAASCF